ncbi:MAG TPA: hypothetical protein VFZ71_09665 [Pyrinomonadaceae bacterium]
MRVTVHFLALALAFASVNAFVHAQQQDVSPNQQRLITRINELLNTTAGDAKKWDDKAVAARTQAQIADLVWETLPDNAADHLKAAWTSASNVEEPQRERSPVVNASLRNSVRRDVLLVARKRAPQLAAIWLEEIVEESKSTAKHERGTFDDRSARSAVLLQMAMETVAHDAQAAAELLIESLRDGISFNLQTVLVRLQQKDAALAETVFRAALARLKTAGMSDPNELLTLYSYLFTPGRVYGANTSDNRNQVQLALGGPRVASPASRQNPSLAREFLEVASDLLLTAPVPEGANSQRVARSLVSVIGALLRETTEQLPEKAALLRARAQQLDSEARFSTTPTPSRADIPDPRPGESKEDFAARRVDLLEETAAKGRDTLTRDIGYATAAIATTVERYQRGLDLTGKIDDKVLRDGVRSWLLYRATLHFIRSGDLDEAQRLNSKNDDVGQRAVCFVVGAQRLVKDKDTIRANEWLREAGMLLKRSEADERTARIALGIVSTYGQFDAQAALEWLSFAVRLVNKTSPASLNDDRAPRFKRISGVTPITDVAGDTRGFSLQSAAGVFPADHFEQALSVLNDLTSPEERGHAVLTLCSNYLKTSQRKS